MPNFADVAVNAVCRYHAQRRPAIAVAHLDQLTVNRWTGQPGFHERVKDVLSRRYDIELVYAYESEGIINASGRVEHHWAILPLEDGAAADAIRQRYTWERLGQMQSEFEKFSERMPTAMRTVTMIVTQLGAARQFVACPDSSRSPDQVLDYIRGL